MTTEDEKTQALWDSLSGRTLIGVKFNRFGLTASGEPAYNMQLILQTSSGVTPEIMGAEIQQATDGRFGVRFALVPYQSGLVEPAAASQPTDHAVITAMFKRAGVDMLPSATGIEVNTPSSTADEDDDHVGPANVGDEDLIAELAFNPDDGSLVSVGAWSR